MIAVVFLGLGLLQGKVVPANPVDYLDIQVGTMPLVLSAPHGGLRKPKDAPDRKEGILRRDVGVREMAFELADAIELRTGFRPFVVATSLHRVKLDANREVEEAAQGGKLATEVWRLYHHALEEAGLNALALGHGHALLLDIHGQTHPEQWIEVGHAVSANVLAGTDADLDDLPGMDAAWIRGPLSMGAFLEAEGYRAVPAPGILHPDGRKYYSGGYITRRHRGNGLRSIQLEFPMHLRKQEGRRESVPKATDAICGFFAEHFSIPRLDLAAQELPTAWPKNIRSTFDRVVDVFGVRIFATKGVPAAKLKHASHMLAEYLDNDENGVVDDAAILQTMLDEGAFLVMPARERDMRRLERVFPEFEEQGWFMGQDLYAEETLPENPPHQQRRGRFDAAIEEILHLVSNGWAETYPEAFAFEKGSRLCDAMDLARRRGGHYHYGDRTCDYSCQAAEYFYWGMTTLAGGQDFPGRAEEIDNEWECSTPASLRERDPAVTALLEDPSFRLPRRLPDGHYRP